VQSCVYVSAFAENVPNPSVKFVHWIDTVANVHRSDI
jgi:hypothetical protein